MNDHFWIAYDTEVICKRCACRASDRAAAMPCEALSHTFATVPSSRRAQQINHHRKENHHDQTNR